MRRLFLLSLVFVAVGLRAQEAHVIALRSDDVAIAKCAWEDLQRSQKQWNKVQEDVRKDYLVVPKGSKESWTWDVNKTPEPVRSGWENGFEFSKDFKYIVPKTYVPNVTGTGNLLFTTPGTNTLQFPPGTSSCLCLDSAGGGVTSCPCSVH